jgi:hypothetical protein
MKLMIKLLTLIAFAVSIIPTCSAEPNIGDVYEKKRKELIKAAQHEHNQIMQKYDDKLKYDESLQLVDNSFALSSVACLFFLGAKLYDRSSNTDNRPLIASCGTLFTTGALKYKQLADRDAYEQGVIDQLMPKYQKLTAGLKRSLPDPPTKTK